VLQLYVVPQAGPGQVLCAERQLPAPHPSSQQDALRSQSQHEQELLQGPHLSPQAASNSSGPGPESPAATATAVAGTDKQRGTVASSSHTATVPVASKSSQSSRSWQGSDADVDEALLFNAAERDLAEVADAIAAAAGPLQDAELTALLADATADIGSSLAGYTAAGTAAASESAGNWSSELGDTAAADGVLRMQTQANDSSTTAADVQQQRQEYQQAAWAPPAATMKAAAAPDASPVAAAAAGFRLPQTLPAARSWMDARSTGMVGAAAGSAGTAVNTHVG